MQPVDTYVSVRERANEELVERHAPLVKRIAHHLVARMPASVGVDDLIQCGLVRLLEAAADYDPSRNASFETYAGIRVRGAMLDEVRAHAWAPRSAHRRAREIAEAMNGFRAEHDREAEPREIAEALGISLDDYHRTLDAVSRGNLLSLEQVLNDDFGGAAEPRAEGVEPAELVSRAQLSARLSEALSALSEREQQVASLYYRDELNLRETGAVLGVSESRVCQIHTQLLLRLRARLMDQL
ncbi:MAG: RNA polymerase sigma factor FliA [Chromatiales bacterium]|jgi:RNA polymerase sigma factor FliA|nr:RNA polymerase sigma factor FliA [Chromatiales bacterium]